MFRYSVFVIGLFSLAACATHHPAPPGPTAAALTSGIDLGQRDKSVRPQDDTYEYLNGGWLRTFELPPDKGTYGSFAMVNDRAQLQLRAIVDALPPDGDGTAKKLSDLYASFMDETRLEELGLAPLQPEFAAIDAMADKRAIAGMIAHFNRTGQNAPFELGVTVDARNSSEYVVLLSQGGLGMPDRDYYLKNDAKLKDSRVKYLAHIEKMFTLANDPQAKQDAVAIVALETEIAQAQWTRVEDRDPIKTYNKTAIADLPALMPGYDWGAFVGAAGIDKVDHVIVRQPSYFVALGKIINATPLPVWKAYFKWRVLSAAAPYLSKPFVEERFAFSGGVLRGIPENQPRWKRGMTLLDGALGEDLGKLYVEKYFPAENKQRMRQLIANLLEAYRQDIGTLDWMSEQTKVGAQAKLAKLTVKVGYPDQWRDYSALRIARGDLLGNVRRADEFDYQRDLGKLGKPIDRGEWGMTPQTVNAYYNPTMNEIVFPAAILQPPFFDALADDAMIYGAIGAVIGHEVSHGFDDRGSQYDADGNLHDWFTQADHEKFALKTKALVDQYNAYEVVPDYHVNGALTLGENIGDNSGLAIAYKAYRLSLGGREAPLIGGLTGAQRFYFAYVQVWRGKTREAEAIQRIKTDPHSPPFVRGTAPLKNQAGFYSAFGVKPGDKMYLPPEQRVNIW